MATRSTRASGGKTTRTKKSSAARASKGVSASDGIGASNEQLEELLFAVEALRDGDFSVRLNSRRRGLVGEISSVLNTVLDHNNQMTKELARIGRVIGREGKMTERFKFAEAKGGWSERADSINSLIDDPVSYTHLTLPTIYSV